MTPPSLPARMLPQRRVRTRLSRCSGALSKHKMDVQMLQIAHFTLFELPGILAVLVAGICLGLVLAIVWLRRTD